MAESCIDLRRAIHSLREADSEADFFIVLVLSGHGAHWL